MYFVSICVKIVYASAHITTIDIRKSLSTSAQRFALSKREDHRVAGGRHTADEVLKMALTPGGPYRLNIPYRSLSLLNKAPQER